MIGDDEEDAPEITKRPRICSLSFRREVAKDDRMGGGKEREIESEMSFRMGNEEARGGL